MPQDPCGRPEFCNPCKEPRTTTFTLELVDAFRKWLTDITCIQWWPAHQELAEDTGQFGVVEFMDAKRYKSLDGVKTAIPGNDQRLCVEHLSLWNMHLRLTVKGTRKKIYPLVEHTISAPDVLMDIEDMYQLIREDNPPVKITKFYDVESLVDESKKCCWENEAARIIELCVTREFSTTAQIIDNMRLRFCEEPAFIAQKCPPEVL